MYVVYVVVSSHTLVITLLFSVFVLEISPSILLEKSKSLKEIMLELSSILFPTPPLVCLIVPFLRPPGGLLSRGVLLQPDLEEIAVLQSWLSSGPAKVRGVIHTPQVTAVMGEDYLENFPKGAQLIPG